MHLQFCCCRLLPVWHQACIDAGSCSAMADAICSLQAGFGARGSAGAMVFTLWTSPNNKNANKALITAQYVGVKVDVPDNFEMGTTNKSPEFLKKNPNGKVGLAAMLLMHVSPGWQDAGMCS